MSAFAATPAVATTFCSTSVANPTACENSLPGDPPSDWEVQGAGDPSIQGFATSMSVNIGGTISFKINTPSTAYHIDILRLGYYGGDGARLIATGIKPSVSLPQTQPACLTSSSTGLIDCGNWAVSASWTVPTQAVSGVYIAHLVRDDGSSAGKDSQIPFVVADPSSHSDILVQTSDETWEAYNDYGGNSLYTCTVACPPGNPLAYKAAYSVSYNRPFDGAFATDGGRSYLYYAEYQLIQFLEENGYNVSYTSGASVDSGSSLLQNHKVFVSSGHDEYWSAGQRTNVQNALAAGVNLAFFSGNEMFWKTRWGASIDGSSTPYRTLTTYKETHFNAPVDPADPPTWTGAWADPRFSPPADGGQPANALTGQQFEINTGTTDIQVPYQYGKVRMWRNTAVARLSAGQTLTLGPGSGTLGYEWDENLDNGFQPGGEFNLSSTTANGLQAFTDYGSTTISNATATHHLTLYRAPSGGLVFGAGTVQWSWGLDNFNAWMSSTTEPSGNPPDPNMQQATINLLADMGAQPSTLISGLVAATKSTDTTPPASLITSPAANATFADGSAVTISGTAIDAGGGVVAGVEVSTDDGSTWHPATLTTSDGTTVNWTYSWIAHGNPTTTIMSRAVDDSGNLENPATGVTVGVSCPCSIWGSNVAPTTVDGGDASSIEVGVKFTSDVYGAVTGVRFYKASTNTGTHIGDLWTASGTLLAQATFTSETASGWQQVKFATPVYINPNTTYVAGYFTPSGHYSADGNYFYSPMPAGRHAIDSAPLHSVSATGLSQNGLYAYSSTPTFPSSSYFGGNYWVDVSFTPAAVPGQVTGVTATPGPGSATVSWSAPTTGGPATQYTVTPYIGLVAQTTTVVSGSTTSTTVSGLTPGTSYTFTVTASNPSGAGPASAQSNAVVPTPLTPPSAPQGVTASCATAQCMVTWSAPANNGGSPVTGYTVTPYTGAAAGTAVHVGASATSAGVTGLTNGTSYTFQVTATNQTGTGAAGVSSAVTPENTILDFSMPAVIDSGDPSSAEVGVKFTSSAAGSITGIRFYKAATNTGTHVVGLWTAAGALLAQASASGETASGWQTVPLTSPVAINANTTYVAAYFAPGGHYSATSGAFASAGISNPPLQALANGTSADGVYRYSSSPTFPTSSYNATNYSVDVMFLPTAVPGQVTNATATAGPGAATVSWAAPSSGGLPTQYTVTPYIGSSAQTPTTVAASITSTTIEGLTGGTTYTFTVAATGANGAGTPSAPSNAVTPSSATAPSAPQGAAGTPATGQALVTWTPPTADGGRAVSSYTVTPYTGSSAGTAVQVAAPATSATVTGLTNGTTYTFQVTATNSIGTGAPATTNSITPANTIFAFPTPTTVDSGDGSSTELGVEFSSTQTGTVRGIRFYKSAANGGTHVGSLWTANGTLLARVTFASETPSGWQEADFGSPVTINAGTTYVASYFAPSGHYSATAGKYSSSVSNPPLTALANSTSPNGVYAYASSPTFPSGSYNATDYGVDVMFTPLPVPGQVTNVTATAGAGSATVSWSAPSSGGPVTQYTVKPYVGSTAQTTTVVSGSTTSTTVSGLTAGTAYTFTVTASNANGSGPESAPSGSVTPSAIATPSAPQAVSAQPATSQALVSWSPPSSNGGSAITGYVVTPYVGATAQTQVTVGASATSATVTGLTNGTTYTFAVTATNSAGPSPPGTSNAIVPEDTIFDFAGPSVVDSGDSSAIEVGVKFTSSVNGSVVGVRFYKAAANTGTHVGALWTAAGVLLAQVAFTGETAAGWQMATFSSPVAITSGATYVVSYFAPNGHYSATPSQFASGAVSNAPLTAVANSTSPNGVYAYATSATFPTSSYNSTGYGVDLLFAP